MNQDRVHSLLQQYLDNTISRDDLALLMQYISTDPANEELYAHMKQQWEQPENDQSMNDAQNELLYQKIINDERFAVPAAAISQPVFTLRRFASIAAGLLFFLGIGLVIQHYLKKSAQLQNLAYLEKVVPLGQKIQIQLADGTVIWINSGSKLKYPLRFAAHTRELYLEGEAYFDVAHDAARPFIIHTGGVSTRVLGTAFNIKAYNNNDFDVAVTRGKVSVGLQNQQLGVLTASEGLTYNSISKQSKRYPVNVNKLRWMHGDLIFDNTKVSDALQILERWYNVKIKLNDESLAEHRFSASFLKHEDIGHVLDVLSEVAHFSYRQQGTDFIIQKQ